MSKVFQFIGNQKWFPRDFVRQFVATVLLASISLLANSQQIVVKGKILDDKSHASIIGGSIRIKGVSGGASTDVNGDFQINATSFPITLLVSSVGYKYQEIDVYENDPITIYLSEDQNKLSEVVVVGYGTQKREDLTGSVSSISTGSLKESSLISFDNALQGKVAGVQVTQASGQPGAPVTVRIRGGNSITGGNDPLYVVDGFPLDNTNADASAGSLLGVSVSALSSINPSDIESIDILKDASSTAIYGARGANGVVIITTKKGKAGAQSVSYDGYYGAQKVSRLIPLLNATEWAQLKNDALATAGKTALFSDADIAALGEGTNWQKEAFRTAAVQNHQVSILGGEGKTRYGISGSYLKQDGVVYGTDFERYSARVNVESEVNKKLKVGVNVNGSGSYSDIASSGTTIGAGEVITSLLYMPPTVSVKDADGNYTFRSPYESIVANPIATLHESTNVNKLYRVLGTSYGEYSIIEGLKAKVLLGTDLLINKQNSYLPATLYEASAAGGIAAVGSKFNTTWLNENTLTYDKVIQNKHAISLLAGFTQQETKTEGATSGSSGYINDILTYNALQNGSTVNTPTSVYARRALQSYLGRVNYNYAQKYFFTSSFRADGSSKFGKNNKWGYFPSAALAWNIGKEEFVKPLTFVSKLKLRTSVGRTGSQAISEYKSLATLSAYQYNTGTSTTLTGYAPSQISNPDLTWETTTQYDLGLDLGLFDERVSLVVDVYYKKTTDLLLSAALPTSSGYTSATANYGSVENKGYEIGITTENVKGKFNWTSNLVFSVNRNTVLDIGNGQDNYIVTASGTTTPSIVKVGQPLGSFWGYKAIGIFKDAADVAANPQLGTQVAGDIKYEDVSKDGTITQAADQTLIGNSQPDFVAGFTNTFSFYNFDLSALFQTSYGNQIYSGLRQNLELTTGYQNGYKDLTDRWSATNTDGKYQRANPNVAAYPNSSRFVEDGSFIRFKTLTLGYTLPKAWASAIKLSSLRAYVTAQNLYTWTKYTGYDPEVNSLSTDNARQGYDNGAYPNVKTILGGLSITF